MSQVYSLWVGKQRYMHIKQLETSEIQNAFLTRQCSERQEVRKWGDQPGLAEEDRSLLEKVGFQSGICRVEK